MNPQPNGISIGSAVFAGLTTVTDRQTDHATRSVTIDRIYVRSTGDAVYAKSGLASSFLHPPPNSWRKDVRSPFYCRRYPKQVPNTQSYHNSNTFNGLQHDPVPEKHTFTHASSFWLLYNTFNKLSSFPTVHGTISLQVFFQKYRKYPQKHTITVVKVRGNAVPGPQKIAGERSQAPHSR